MELSGNKEIQLSLKYSFQVELLQGLGGNMMVDKKIFKKLNPIAQ